VTSRVADKICVPALAAVLIAMLLPACDDGRTAQRSNLNNSRPASQERLSRPDNHQAAREGDFGEDWDAQARAEESGNRSQRSIRSIRRIGQAETGDQASTGAAASRPIEEPFWTIVLGTFSGGNHEQAARTMISELQRIAPELIEKVRPHTTRRGSMVIFGRYPDADEPSARRDLQRIKEIRYRERPIFAKAFLSRITPRTGDASNPHALMSVRKTYPDVDPLYTLQIAAWGDFDSGTMTMDEVRRKAENHVRRLRSQGHEAYFHHDPGQKLSIITVGLFDRTAIDAETGERSPELRMLLRQFPAHLVNGEELQEPIDRHRPERGTRVQQPHLVLVPLP